MSGAPKVVNVEAAADGRRAARDDAASAFERLFLAEYARVARIAYRVVADPAEAEDVAQEVFVAFHRRHRGDEPYATRWLHTAAVHTALNAVRSRRRRAAHESRAGGDEAIDPHDVAETNERRRAVRGALARLPAKPATVLVLRHSGHSYAEVAAAIGINVNQVGTLLRRAEAALRKELSQ